MAALLFVLLASMARLSLRAADDWRPVTTADLAAPPPASELDAPALVLLREVDVDARKYGEEQRVEEYVRVKIFDPGRATAFTRVRQMWSSSDRPRFDITARLTLPDGQMREFGAKDTEERTVASRGAARSRWERLVFSESAGLRERFLVIKGVVPGSIIEYRLHRVEAGTNTFLSLPLQSDEAPVKLATLRYQRPQAGQVFPKVYLLNAAPGQGEVREEKGGEVLVATVRDLRSFPEEPFSGAPFERLVAAIVVVTDLAQGMNLRHTAASVKVNVKRDGEWSPIASREYLLEADAVRPDAAVKLLAREISATSPDPAERARLIYERVEAEYDEFSRRKVERGVPRSGSAEDLGEVLQWRKRKDSLFIPDAWFHYLAIALFRECGLEAHTVRIAGRKVLRFRDYLPEEATLPRRAIAVKLGADWRYCMIVKKRPLPFGWLPWEMEGEVALVAKTGKQEFLGVPYQLASDSAVTTTGELTLAENGDLTGTLSRTYTGHSAATLRERIWALPETQQREKVQGLVRPDFGPAEVTVERLENAEICTKPLVVTLGFRHPGFAVATDTRLLFRAQVTQAGVQPPFTAEKRGGPVLFPFPWSESDRLMLHLPPGWRPESLPGGRPIRHGDFLAYGVKLQFDQANNVLSMRREFAVKDWLFEVDQYAGVKRWFDAVAASDQQEITFVR